MSKIFSLDSSEVFTIVQMYDVYYIYNKSAMNCDSRLRSYGFTS